MISFDTHKDKYAIVKATTLTIILVDGQRTVQELFDDLHINEDKESVYIP